MTFKEECMQREGVHVCVCVCLHVGLTKEMYPKKKRVKGWQHQEIFIEMWLVPVCVALC